MDTISRQDEAVRRRLDGELRLVHEAILMVAAGGAPRVLVAGLRLGQAVLDPARRLANDAGVHVVPLWTADEQALDILVQAAKP
ncbi:MAG TPA: hypothetical protein VES19_01000 [Candidatus Limnocylindrales bacterium]|nr:hypothetical protein [Candidatus Limnocylindrales bacterium]